MNKIANFLNARISGLVTDKPEILAAYSRDASILEIMPKLLCLPQTVEDIQYVVRFVDELAKKGYRLPVSVRGSGLDQSGADLSEGIVLSTEKLNKIHEIDDRERLVRVQAGVTLGQLNSALALFGLRLPVEADERETIGGIVSNFYTDKIAKKYGVSIPQLCIRYDWQLGMITLPKTANPDHQKENMAIDFMISDEDMKTLKNMERIESYGEFGFFPVYGGKLKGYSGKPRTEIVD